MIHVTAIQLNTHRARMRYVEYHRQGYQIGSGMIENAAKQIGIMSMMVLGAIWNEVKACKVAKAKASYLCDQLQSLPLAI